MRKAWLFPFVLLVLVSLAGAFSDPSPPANAGGPVNSGDVAWMLTATGLILLMTPGLSLFYGGMVRFNNVISTMLQSFVAMVVISVLWVVVGFSLAFGDSVGGIIGHPGTYFMFHGVNGVTHAALSPTIPLVLFAIFHLKFAIITPALITGSLAERVRFSAYLTFMCLFSLLIYCPLAHMTWHPDGLLRQLGVIDFAGGSVVHVSAGCAALAGAIVLGRRQMYPDAVPPEPANIPFVLLGTGMLWFGWFGFNAGSALAASPQAAMAFATTNTASASAALAWMLFDSLRGRKPTALGACIGALVGLVAITPAAGHVTVGASLFIGTAAALVCNAVVHWRSRSALDDTLYVFPCHGVGGAVGMVATGVFARDAGLVTGQVHTFLVQLVAIVVVPALTFGGSWLLYKLTDVVVPLRVDVEQEAIGLDLSQHGETTGDLSSLYRPTDAPIT